MSSGQSFLILFATIGIIWNTYYFILLIWNLVKLCISQPDLLQTYGKNSWAVVTGATGSIGQEFSKLLSVKGFNIVLLGKDDVKLEQLKNEIMQIDEDAQVRIVKADFTKSMKPGFFRKIQKQLQDIDVSMLVNCAGNITAGSFMNITEDQVNEMILINCLPIVNLTRRLLHKMLQRKKRSAIINVTAAYADFPCPYNSIFGGVKSFQDYLSRSLAYELQKKKVDVLTLRPTLISSNMNQNQDKYGAISAEEFVEGGLGQLGKEQESYGNWGQRFQNWVNSLLPDIVRLKINNDYHKQNIFRYNYAEENDKDEESIIGEDDDDDEDQAENKISAQMHQVAETVTQKISNFTNKLLKK